LANHPFPDGWIVSGRTAQVDSDQPSDRSATLTSPWSGPAGTYGPAGPLRAAIPARTWTQLNWRPSCQFTSAQNVERRSPAHGFSRTVPIAVHRKTPTLFRLCLKSLRFWLAWLWLYSFALQSGDRFEVERNPPPDCL
jgi:hypothetical protein